MLNAGFSASCRIIIGLSLCHSLHRSVILLSIFRTYKSATQQAINRNPGAGYINFLERPWQQSEHLNKSFTTTCCYCGVGCGIVVHKNKKGSISIEGDEEHPVNKGMLCSKGINLHHTANDTTDRLLTRKCDTIKACPLQRVNWDTALERTAAVFKTFINKYGPDSVAFYVSGQCLTEEYYVVIN
jgi:anaerobic selenocysteine-containing dehydrogenase